MELHRLQPPVTPLLPFAQFFWDLVSDLLLTRAVIESMLAPCLLLCERLDTSHLTNQCRTISSAPNLLPRPASSLHFDACLSTPRLSFFAKKELDRIQPHSFFSTPHVRAFDTFFSSDPPASHCDCCTQPPSTTSLLIFAVLLVCPCFVGLPSQHS